jgi:hypothetical protein
MPQSLTYRQTVSQAPFTLGFTAPAVVSQNVTFTPSAQMIRLFDDYVINAVRFMMYDNESNTVQAPYVVCWDPSNDTAGSLTTALAIRNYENSKMFQLEPNNPVFELTVVNPTHAIQGAAGGVGFELSRSPCKTDNTWDCGTIYVGEFITAAVIVSNACEIEFSVTFMHPRQEIA